MGERCGVAVEIEFEEDTRTQAFWKLFKEREGGIPGQKDTWRGKSQWTSPLNASRDRIGIYVGHQELLWLYIRAGERQASKERTARTQRYSWMIRDQMDDQQLGENLEKNSADGMTITVQKHWARDDEGEWPEAAQWIREQFERLRTILAESSRQKTEDAAAAYDRQTTSDEASAMET